MDLHFYITFLYEHSKHFTLFITFTHSDDRSEGKYGFIVLPKVACS